ncbi:hypothetical protein [Amycolatopsis sp. PS_44_ISF1]|uniref:hypothetical protein n=1 Tax=Amycolatopsis sp. PS_44_ISF1 TaxID=2974917 RepID=UPI0028E07637|nr:hypothetical protein [Amycolatopsis sp. PS_44_ISF1]MDT8914984.1 hypothetical protein [Amycolatopsis sp. PS_44_ISF1]
MTPPVTASRGLTLPVIPDPMSASVRRVIALTRGIRAADVPDAAVAEALRADHSPICWPCHESRFDPATPRCPRHGG